MTDIRTLKDLEIPHKSFVINKLRDWIRSVDFSKIPAPKCPKCGRGMVLGDLIYQCYGDINVRHCETIKQLQHVFNYLFNMEEESS